MTKLLLGITAATWLIGQAAGTLGLPVGLGGFANLTAIVLMGFMFYRVILKDGPKERLDARAERVDARKHTEQVVLLIVEQHRTDRKLDRELLTSEFGRRRIRNGE